MPSVKQIAQDPHGALRRLEKSLGANEGELLEDMRALSDGDWSEHLPYSVADAYFDDAALQVQYAKHVDSCVYCKALLDAIHPTDEQVDHFAKEAAAAAPPAARGAHSWWVHAGLAASVTLIALMVSYKYLGPPTAEEERQALIDELRAHPNTLVELESFDNAGARFQAAQYYFALEQPQLAYRQIGQALRLSGVAEEEVAAISHAADVPAADSGETIGNAASSLDARGNTNTTSRRSSSAYLEQAQSQARLGLHNEALRSIQRYLEAKDTDPNVISEYSKAAVAAYEPQGGMRQ